MEDHRARTYIFPPRNGRQRVALGALHRCLFSCYPCVGNASQAYADQPPPSRPSDIRTDFSFLSSFAPPPPLMHAPMIPEGGAKSSSAPLLLCSSCSSSSLVARSPFFFPSSSCTRSSSRRRGTRLYYTILYGYSITRYSITRMCPPASHVLSFFLALY